MPAAITLWDHSTVSVMKDSPGTVGSAQVPHGLGGGGGGGRESSLYGYVPLGL